MKQIYTRTGDEGMTSLREGVRVPKESLRIEVNGCLDELNALLGIVRTLLPADGEEDTLLKAVQRELMVVMSHIATPPDYTNPKPLRTEELIITFEQTIDRWMADGLPAGFVLPGGSPLSAQLHFARTVARRAERRLWSLHREAPIENSILRFINRLSDLLFSMALRF